MLAMKWQLRQNKTINSKNKDKIAEIILKARGLGKIEIDNFLNPPNIENINLQSVGIEKKDFTKFKKRIDKAVLKKEKVVIFGDYDCDGVCSTAILWQVLKKYGLDVMPYIPDRFSDGYGIKSGWFESQFFEDQNPSLVITIDNGIVAKDAVDYSRKLNIDIMVIDHHLDDGKVNASCILHSTMVCASTLAFLISKEFGHENTYLDLATIGTVADQMPLVGINRAIVKQGLKAVEKTQNLGLKYLISSLNLTKVGVYEIGYMIAPRINAMGRLTHALDSLRLLCTSDKNRALRIIDDMNRINSQRQMMVDDILQVVLKSDLGNQKIVVYKGEINEGVIGLVAGKITEKTGKPSIVFSLSGDVSKASARSIKGFNIIEEIKKTNLILEGGGHPMAAGFSIETSKIDKFKREIEKIADKKIKDEDLIKSTLLDLEVDLDVIDKDLVEKLAVFEPTGYGNPQPTFLMRKIKVANLKAIGKDGKHAKFTINNKLPAIAFSQIDKIQENKDKDIQIAASLTLNTWNGNTDIQVLVREIKVDDE